VRPSKDNFAPPVFHCLFSLGIGLVTTRFVHAHELAMLLVTQVVWVLSLVFIRVRGQRADGKFLETEVYIYEGISIPAYVTGLLFGVCAYAVLG
jgi:hypothetical protein